MKKGIIRISDDFYQNDFDVVKTIFNSFRPTHIEYRHWDNNIWYLYGESIFFEEVKEGELIPFYSVSIVTDVEPNGLKTYKAKFVKEK